MRFRVRRFPALMSLTAVAMAAAITVTACGPAGGASTTPTVPSSETPGIGAPGASPSPYWGGSDLTPTPGLGAPGAAVTPGIETTPYPSITPNPTQTPSSLGPAGSAVTPTSTAATEEDTYSMLAQATARMGDVLRQMAQSGDLDPSQAQMYLGRMSQVVGQIANEPSLWEGLPSDLSTRVADNLSLLATALQKAQLDFPNLSPAQRQAALSDLASAMDTLSSFSQELSQSMPQISGQEQSRLMQMLDQLKTQAMAVWSQTGTATAVPQTTPTP